MNTRTIKFLVAAAAAAAASGAVVAQPEPELTSIDSEEQLLERIAELQIEGGPTAAGLIDPLRGLALLHQEAGDHALAIAALEEAIHITRVNRGLASVDEVLLLWQQIRNEEALGNPERVLTLELEMVRLARQHHDDIRMVPIFRGLADDRSDLLRRFRAGEFPPEIYLGCYYAGGLGRYDDARVDPTGDDFCRRGIANRGGGGSSSAVVAQLRAEILMHYADAIEVIVKNGDYASQELRDLERQAVRLAAFPRLLYADRVFASVCPRRTLDELLASELLGTCLEPVILSGYGVIANVGGWVSLVRLLAYEIRSGAPATARANALVELADWHLLAVPADRRRFEEITNTALELYERAYRELEEDMEARASIFSPEVPVTFTQRLPEAAGLPAGRYTHAPDTFASAATVEASRYIDVSFDITKHGRGERIEILETSRGATAAEERDFTRFIEQQTSFRPRFIDGKLADSAPVVVRYHLPGN